jgi:hypothetical protein
MFEVICDPSGCSNAAPPTTSEHIVRGLVDDGSGNVFWTCEAADAGANVRYHPVNVGGPMDILAGEPGAYGIIYTGFGGNGYLYFTRREAAGRVRRCLRDGSNPVDWVTGLQNPEGLTADFDTVWIADTDADRIARCPLQTGCGTTATTFAPAHHPHAVIADDKNVYWSNGLASGGSVSWCPKTGCPASGPGTLAANQPNPLGLLVDGEYVYWANSVAGGAVMRIRKP